MAETKNFQAVYQQQDNERLDKVLPDLFLELDISRAKAQKLIKDNCVKINGKLETKSSTMLVSGDIVEIEFADKENQDLEPYEFPLEIIYEDEELLVINKPAGLTVHPGSGNSNKTLVNALIWRQTNLSNLGDKYRPGIVHRLDKDTSGLIVVAKSDNSHRKLADQFKSKKASREYKALCLINPRRTKEVGKKKQGVIEVGIGRSQSDRVKMSTKSQKPKLARTFWKVDELFFYAALLSLRLDTGRTHQIRVHMEYLGSPVLGDKHYGNFEALPKELFEAVKKFSRQALHAEKLKLFHPKTGEEMEFCADLPVDFKKLIKLFRDFDAKLSSK